MQRIYAMRGSISSYAHDLTIEILAACGYRAGMPSLMMPMSEHLELDRCPHCGVASPSMKRVLGILNSTDHMGRNLRAWAAYQCGRCGGVVLTGAPRASAAGAILPINEVFPTAETVDDDVPEPVRRYLQQALESLHAPDGAVMLAGSAVDAMLKLKNLQEGSLYSRIKKAADTHLITKDMETWAHQVRLDANDPRHADDAKPHHDAASAKLAVDFTRALAQFMYVLPARVTRGIEAASAKPSKLA